MKYGAGKAVAEQATFGGHDFERRENTPGKATAASRRWTTYAQVSALLAHPIIREIWPEDAIAADPCAGSGVIPAYVTTACHEHKLPLPWRWRVSDIAAAHELPTLMIAAERMTTLGYPTTARYKHCARRLPAQESVDIVVTNLPWFGVWDSMVHHWRRVAFPNAVILALCDDQERRDGKLQWPKGNGRPGWLADGNMPYAQLWLPGRQRFEGADDGKYPWTTSWGCWLPGDFNRTETRTVQLTLSA